MPAYNDPTRAAWEMYVEELTRLPGVIYVSTGYRIRGGERTNEEVIVVSVNKKLAPGELTPQTIVPRVLPLPNGELVGTDVVEEKAGYPTPDVDSALYRPVPGGCEIGAFGSIFLGTLGGWFCSPDREESSGWTPVWLTNAHVADPNTFSTIPADSRMTQPWAGGVIGNTTAISGWPNPFPAPNVTVGGVADAAIGALNDDVAPDYRVIDIGDAVYEIGTAADDMSVQKRGRTTELTNGTVITFVAANVRSPAGGLVTFGLPGQPPVFRIRSLGTGLGPAFGAPGDSGSLVFSSAHGELEETYPCVGLYFAGDYAWVADQPNPNLYTVTGLAFDIGAIMGLFPLETICNCVVRSLIASVFGQEAREAESTRTELTRNRVRVAEKMMRRFRAGVLERSTVGKVISKSVAQNAPFASRVLAEDPVAYGLAVEMLEPWVKASTSLAVLNQPIDERTVGLANELAKRVTERYPDKAEQIEPMLELLRENEGAPVRKMIGRLRIP